MHIPTQAIDTATLAVLVGAIVQVVKDYVPANSKHDANVRVLAAVAGLLGAALEMMVPAATLQNLILGLTAGFAAIGAYPVVKGAGSLASSVSLSRSTSPAPAPTDPPAA